jgi:tape measure domain-containing protein
MTLGDLIVKIGGDTKDFDNSIKEVKKSVGGIGESLKSGLAIGAGLKIFDAISEGFTSAVSAGWNFNSTMEQTLASFQTMLGGSKEKADAMVTTLQKMASTTPFETTELAKGATTLMGFGIEASKVESTLRMLGDVSQGNKERFNSLTLAFAQVQSAGKLTGQDLLQMINAGFNPLQTISDQTGKSLAVLKDEMSKGAISADMVTQAFQGATSAGGLFYGAMEKQSKTFEGQMSTLQDAISMTFGTILQPLFTWASTVGLPKIIELTTKVQELFTSSQESTFFKNAKESIEFLNPVIENIQTIMKGVIDFVKGWVATFKESFKKLSADLKITWDYIKRTFDSLRPAFEVIWNFIKPILDNFVILLKFLYDTAYGVINGIILAFNPFVRVITSSFATITNIISAFISLLKGDFSQAFNFFKSAVMTAIEGVKNVFLTLYNFFDGLTKGMVTRMVNMGQDIVKGLWNGISNNIAWLKSKITGWISGVSSQIKSFFGISSPSKLMKEYGQYVTEGFGIGINSNSNMIKDAIQNMTDFTFDATKLKKDVTNTIKSISNNVLKTPALNLNSNQALTTSAQYQSMTSGNMTVYVQLDGRTIAKATAPNMVKELKLQGVYS